MLPQFHALGLPVTRRTPWLLHAVLGVAFVFYAFVVCLPEWDFVYYPLDDAYYYLKTARYFAETGAWTFDGGLSVTNGFHPLYLLFCALVWKCFPADPLTVARMIMLANVAFGCGAGYFLYRILFRLTANAWFSICVVACGLFNVFALHMMTNLMETCLYMLCLSIVLHRLCARPRIQSMGQAITLGIMLAMAVLARTEAVLLVPFVVGHVLLSRCLADWRRWRWRMAIIVGAIPTAALLVFYAIAYHKTGCFLQMSGSIHQLFKSDLRPLQGIIGGLKGAVLAVSTCFQQFNGYEVSGTEIAMSRSAPLTVLCAVGALSYLLVFLVPTARRRFKATLPFVLFVAATLLYYAIAHRGETHPRYEVGVFICFVALFSAAVHRGVGWLTRRGCCWMGLARARRWLRLATGAGLATLVCSLQVAPFVSPPRLANGTQVDLTSHLHLSCVRHRGTNKIPFQDMQRTAIYLQQNMEQGTVLGGFDCGQHAYYSGFRVMNLDGVINNQAALARIRHDILGYVLASRIEYIVQMQDHTYDYFRQKPGMEEQARQHIIQVARVPDTVFYGGFGIFKVVRDPVRYRETVAAGRYSVMVNGKLNRERF